MGSTGALGWRGEPSWIGGRWRRAKERRKGDGEGESVRRGVGSRPFGGSAGQARARPAVGRVGAGYQRRRSRAAQKKICALAGSGEPLPDRCRRARRLRSRARRRVEAPPDGRRVAARQPAARVPRRAKIARRCVERGRHLVHPLLLVNVRVPRSYQPDGLRCGGSKSFHPRPILGGCEFSGWRDRSQPN